MDCLVLVRGEGRPGGSAKWRTGPKRCPARLRSPKSRGNGKNSTTNRPVARSPPPGGRGGASTRLGQNPWIHDRKGGSEGSPRGGQPFGSGRQLPPQLTIGRRPLGGGGGGGGGGGASEGGGFREGEWGGGYRRGWGGGLREGRLGGGVQVGQFGVVVGGGGPGWTIWGVGGGGGGGHGLPLPPLALPLTIPSP